MLSLFVDPSKSFKSVDVILTKVYCFVLAKEREIFFGGN